MADINKMKETACAWASKNASLIKGICALLAGIMLAYWSHRVIVYLIAFTAGLMLIYYGLAELKVKKATDFIDMIIARIKKLF